MGMNALSTITPAVSVYYDRVLLKRFIGANIHDKFAQMRPLPKHNSDTAKFQKYPSLDIDTAPHKEGVPKSGKTVTPTAVTATVRTYGSHMEYTDDVVDYNQDPQITIYTELLGENMGTTMDYLRRDVMITGTQVIYATGASRAAQAAPLNEKMLRMAIRLLASNNAKKITKQGHGTQELGTQPIAPAYVGLVHPHTTAQLKRIPDFIPVHKYPSTVKPMENEVGAYDGIRFLESTNCKVYNEAGAAGDGTFFSSVEGVGGTDGSNNDVYVTQIIARDYYGIVDLRGENAKTIIKPIGSAGAADPYDSFGTIAWKAKTTTVILDDDMGVRLEHCNYVELDG